MTTAPCNECSRYSQKVHLLLMKLSNTSISPWGLGFNKKVSYCRSRVSSRLGGSVVWAYVVASVYQNILSIEYYVLSLKLYVVESKKQFGIMGDSKSTLLSMWVIAPNLDNVGRSKWYGHAYRSPKLGSVNRGPAPLNFGTLWKHVPSLIGYHA